MTTDKTPKTANCHWSEDCGVWQTSCNKAFEIIDGTPEDNGMKYCCYCGRPLIEDRDDSEV